MSIEPIRAYWDAFIYDLEETETCDVEFLLSAFSARPLRILEACCGTGRILVPLAQAGHDVVGFDLDEAMLARLQAKAQHLPNLHYFSANMLSCDWGSNFDAVINSCRAIY